MDRKHFILIIILLFLFIAVSRLLFPELDHGDEYSDANVMIAGENFVRLGFLKAYFLPSFEPRATNVSNLYTHYPPLPDLINGALRIIGSTDSLLFYRTFSVFIALLNLVFWHLFIEKFSNSRVIAFLSSIFYISNPLFIFCADSLHQLSYSDFLRSLGLFLFIKAITSKQRRKMFLTLLWIALAILSMVTYEYIIYFAVFIIGFSLFFSKTFNILSKKEILFLLLAPVFGFILHFIQNTIYFGSFHSAIEDMKNAALKRTLYGTDSPPLTFVLWLEKIILGNLSLVFIYGYYILIMVIFLTTFLYLKLSNNNKTEIKPLLRLIILFFICGISWYVFFPAHSWHHVYLSFLARHLLPVAALSFCLLIHVLYTYLNNKHSTSCNTILLKNIFIPKLLPLLVTAGIIISGILNSELPVTPEKIKHEEEFVNFKTCLRTLGNYSYPQNTIGVNYFRYPFMQYYTQRRCLPVLDKSSFETSGFLPDYFIYLPYNTQSSNELLATIMQRYTIIFQCNSARFPAFIFKLKT